MSKTEILRLADQFGEEFSALIANSVEAPPEASDNGIVTELEFVQEMQARAGVDSAYLDFSAAGVYDYYRPALVNRALSCGDMGDGRNDPALVEKYLSELGGLPEPVLSGQGLVATLAQFLVDIAADRSGAQAGGKRILVPASLSPSLRGALSSRLKIHGLDIQVVGFDPSSGCVDERQLASLDAASFVAFLLPWPNFFGLLENVGAISAWASKANVHLLGLLNVHLLSWLKSPALLYPGAFNSLVGDCQALGFSPSSCGSAACFIATDERERKRFPNRESFQPPSARSMALLNAALIDGGVERMRRAGNQGRDSLNTLLESLLRIDSVSLAFDGPHVNEVVLRVSGVDLDEGRRLLARHNIVAGIGLGEDFPELADCLLLHCNDRHRDKDIERFANRFAAMVKNLTTAPCPVKPRFN